MTHRAAALAGYALLFIYLLFIRTHGITESFSMLGDQIRDWRIALGPFSALPLVGTPSTAGGTTLGPVFYWVLWVTRLTAGPFTDDLPHAGAIGLAVVQSAADLFLLYALLRRRVPPALALASILLIASSPQDLAFTQLIWNPPLAVALSKVTIALVIIRPEWSMWRLAAVTLTGWLAVQAHMAALFVSLPAIAWMVQQPAVVAGREPRPWSVRLRYVLAGARTAIEIVVLLQVPYAIHHWNHPSGASGEVIWKSVGYSVANPATLRFRESASHFGTALDHLVLAPHQVTVVLLVVVVAAAIAVAGWWREPEWLVVTVAPIVLAIAGFAAWRGALNEHYWYLPLVPSVVLTGALALAAIPWSAARTTAAMALLIAVVIAQPERCRAAWASDKLPGYGALVRASRQMLKQTPELRTISAPWLPRSSDAAFPYEILGGRISNTAPLEAYVDPEGRVSYRPAVSQ